MLRHHQLCPASRSAGGAPRRCLGWLAAVLGVWLALVPGAAPAQAPDAAPPPAEEASAPDDAETRQRIEALIATLEDDARRGELVETLRLLLATDGGAGADTAGETAAAPAVLETLAARIFATLESGVSDLVAQFTAAGEALANLPAAANWLTDQLESEIARARWTNIATGLALVLGGGLVAAALARRGLSATRRRLDQSVPDAGSIGQSWRAALRLIVALVPVLAFAAIGYAIAGGSNLGYGARLLALSVVNALVAAAVCLTTARAVLAPTVAALRPAALNDEDAVAVYGLIRRLTVAGTLGFLIAEAGVTLGLSPVLREALLSAIGLVLAGMLVLAVLRYRDRIGRAIAGRPAETPAADGPPDAQGPPDPGTDAIPEAAEPGRWALLRRLTAEVWHGLAIAYILVAYAIFALKIEGGFGFLLRATVMSAAILAAAHVLANVVLAALYRLSAAARDPGKRAPGNPGSRDAQALKPGVAQSVRAGVFAGALVLVLDAWGLGTLDLLFGEVGRALLDSVASIIIILAIALAVWEIASRLIARQLARTERAGSSPSQVQRQRTLLPLLRNVVLVILVTVVLFMVLSELGIDIAPLLAGAGVVGLAVGFGAQTLVKDVISGLFNLLENTVAVGDVVEVGSHSGLVESMSIRTVRLRDLAGNVHTIPFGDVTAVTNMTRGFSYYVFDIGVAYREDIDAVMAVIREIGDELGREMPYASLILAPIEILGVDAFTDSAVVVKARIKTTPINQWTVGREFNRRLKNRFDALGIEIPFPHTTVYFGQDKAGGAPAAPVRLTAPDLLAALAARDADPRAKAKPSLKKRTAPKPGRGDDLPESHPGDDGD